MASGFKEGTANPGRKRRNLDSRYAHRKSFNVWVEMLKALIADQKLKKKSTEDLVQQLADAEAQHAAEVRRQVNDMEAREIPQAAE